MTEGATMTPTQLFEDVPREWSPEEFEQLQAMVEEVLIAFMDFAGRLPNEAELRKIRIALYARMTEPGAPSRAQ